MCRSAQNESLADKVRAATSKMSTSLGSCGRPSCAPGKAFRSGPVRRCTMACVDLSLPPHHPCRTATLVGRRLPEVPARAGARGPRSDPLARLGERLCGSRNWPGLGVSSTSAHQVVGLRTPCYLLLPTSGRAARDPAGGSRPAGKKGCPGAGAPGRGDGPGEVPRPLEICASRAAQHYSSPDRRARACR
jgi:hypothetical protein